MSLYDKLARLGRKKGDFKIADAPKGWTEPAAEKAPAELRNQLRSEMERIVEKEAESISSDTNQKHQEGKMKLAKFVKFREEKFGAVLFETRQEKVYTLNPTGAAVVREILAGTSNVMEKIKNNYQDAPASIETEVNEFLADLKTKGLIVE